MGSWAFSTTAWGKTPEEAFRSAVEEARYEHGHGGYTGTIAEKGGFALFELPPRVKAKKFVDLVSSAADMSEGEYLHTLVRELEGAVVRASSADKPVARRRLAEAKKNLKTHERDVARFERAAGDLLPLVRRAATVYDDKWGPAVAVEIKGTEAATMTYRAKPKRGYRLFLFCGYASS